MAIPMELPGDTEYQVPHHPNPVENPADGDRGALFESDALAGVEHDTELDIMRSIRSRIKPSEKHAYTTNDLELFKKEAARYPRLDRAEEIALARIIDRGKSAAAMLESVSELSVVNLRPLQRLINTGNEARDLLIFTNLKLVFFVSKKFPQHTGMERLDLIQEGTFGLQRAADRFDWRQGYKFSTYAYPGIYRCMQRAIEQRGRIIRTPVAGQVALREVFRENDVVDTELLDENLRMVAAANSPLSIDKPMYDDSDADMKSTLTDPRASVEKEVIDKLDVERINDLIAGLPEQDAQVVRLYLGLDNGIPLTFRQITEQLQKKHGWAHYRYKKSINVIREALENPSGEG